MQYILHEYRKILNKYCNNLSGHLKQLERVIGKSVCSALNLKLFGNCAEIVTPHLENFYARQSFLVVVAVVFPASCCCCVARAHKMVSKTNLPI